MRPLLLAVALAGAIAASPVAAGAATVKSFPPYSDYEPGGGGEVGGYIVVEDARAQDNDLRVRVTKRLVTVVERGQRRLVAGRNCHRRSVHEVFCRAHAPDNFVYVDGGRGDDLLSARCRTPGVDISGGPGADRLISNGCGAALSGEPGNDVLVGDRWPQVLRGGGGDDRLFGRAGDDLLYGDGSAKRSGDDAIDGGPGRDTAAWDERSSGIRADLGRGFERSEDYDTLRGVENLVGTREDDVLIGNGGRNRLRGGNGTDLLDGRGGDDLLDGGYGSLIYSDVDDDDPDRFRCAGGRDVVRFPGPVVLPLGCELMRDDYPLEFGTLRVRPRAVGAHAVQVQVVCDTSRSVCRRRVVISAGGRELGRTALVTDPPEVMRVDLKRAAPRDGVVNIVVEGDDGDPDADPEDGPVPYRFKWRIACTGAPRRDVCRVGG